MMLCFLFSALIVVLDQFFKQWVVRTIEIGREGPEIIPGILGLTRWENDGAMLNFLSGQQWLLAGIAFIASVVLIMILLRYNEGFWGTIGLAAVLGGSVGNLLDRIFNEGRVIDMFRTLFISFPIFNIADIFITLGFITFLIHFVALTFKEDGKASASPQNRNDTDSDIEAIPVDMPMQAESAQPAAEAYSQRYAVSEMPPAPALHVSPVQAVSPPSLQQVPPQQEQQQIQPLPVTPQENIYPEPVSTDYAAPASEYSIDSGYSFTLEALEAELGSLDIDYDVDVDDLLREYGLENDSSTV